MRGTVAAHSISKSYGGHQVLDRVSLAVTPGARVGVIGPNGCGKSTLLRILGELEQPDAGSVKRSPPSTLVGYLPQDVEARGYETVRDYLARRVGVADAEQDLSRRAAAVADGAGQLEAYTEALEQFLALGGGDFEVRAAGACESVGLDRDLLARPLTSLSGGQRARAALASISLARFDVLLLDEPTNDLDFDGLELLEEFVAGLDAGVVVVSHDRAFLDRVVNRVLEFEAETGRTTEFTGTFSQYEQARERARSRHEAAFQHYAEERERFTSLLRERRTQARMHGPGAGRRGTHALSSKVRASERRLERVERVDKPWRPWELQMSIARAARPADRVVSLAGVVVERGSFILGPIDLELMWGDRLAVLGPNGSGKTTLLQALLGTAPLTSGTRRVGPGVVFGELDQGRELFDASEPLLALFPEEAGVRAADSRTLLAKFGLSAEDILRPTASLSAGERTRAVLALFASRSANCLVLDEPTNHLDLEAIEQLESALATYEGTVVLVTHDRRFLEAFDASRTLAVEAFSQGEAARA